MHRARERNKAWLEDKRQEAFKELRIEHKKQVKDCRTRDSPQNDAQEEERINLGKNGQWTIGRTSTASRNS